MTPAAKSTKAKMQNVSFIFFVYFTVLSRNSSKPDYSYTLVRSEKINKMFTLVRSIIYF